MRALTEAKNVTLPNAWGRDSTTTRQRFEIEATDVGTKRDSYLGHGRPGRMFTRADVGRVIETMSAPGYACWSFVN